MRVNVRDREKMRESFVSWEMKYWWENKMFCVVNEILCRQSDELEMCGVWTQHVAFLKKKKNERNVWTK